jgi:hypothetical protein
VRARPAPNVTGEKVSGHWGDWRYAILDETYDHSRPRWWQSNGNGGRLEFDYGSDQVIGWVIVKLRPDYPHHARVCAARGYASVTSTSKVTLELIDEAYTTVFSYQLHTGTDNYELNIAKLSEKTAA